MFEDRGNYSEMFIAIKAGRGTTPIKVVSLALAIAIFGCGGGGSSNHGTIVGPEGPTPIHGLVVASGLNGPMMYIANPVDKTLGYVLERSGRIRVLVKDVLQANSLPVDGIPEAHAEQDPDDAGAKNKEMT